MTIKSILIRLYKKMHSFVPGSSEHVVIIVFLILADFVEGVVFDVIHVEERETNRESNHTNYVEDDQYAYHSILTCHVVHITRNIQVNLSLVELLHYCALIG